MDESATTAHPSLLTRLFGESYEFASVTQVDVYIFLTFLSLWFSAYWEVVHSENGVPNGFDKSRFISNLHSVPLVVLGLLSLWELIPETVPVAFSTSFFIVDVVDCIVRQDLMWGFHGVISFVLNVGSGMSGVHRQLRSTSKGFFAEASTPFLNRWKKTKTKKDFVIFFIVFTVCRIIWVPYFLYQTYAIHLKRIDWLLYPSIAFMVLQLAWYAKACKMFVNYKVPDDNVGGGRTMSKKEIRRAMKEPGKSGKKKKKGSYEIPEDSKVSYVYPNKQE